MATKQAPGRTRCRPSAIFNATQRRSSGRQHRSPSIAFDADCPLFASARLAELVDAADLGSAAARCGGSSPSPGTTLSTLGGREVEERAQGYRQIRISV